MASIKELLPDPPVNYSVAPGDTVMKAAQLMGEKNVGIVMVIDAGSLVGVFSERDFMRRVIGVGKDPKKTTLAEVMTKRVVIAREDDDAEICLEKMEKEGCRHLPVVSGDKPMAMLSIRDLMRYALRAREIDLKMLKEYVASS